MSENTKEPVDAIVVDDFPHIDDGHYPQSHKDTLGRDIVALGNHLAEGTVGLSPRQYKRFLRQEAARQIGKDKPPNPAVGYILKKVGIEPALTPAEVAGRYAKQTDVGADYHWDQHYDSFSDAIMSDILTREKMFQSDRKKQQLLEGEIDTLRANLQNKRGQDRQQVARAIGKTMSPFQQQQFNDWTVRKTQSQPKKSNEVVGDVIDWLTETTYNTMPTKTHKQQLKRAKQRREDDARVLNFLQAHNHHIKERQQDPEFLEKVDVEKKRWHSMVERGVKEGWLHEWALQRADVVDSITVYEGDEFSTQLSDRGGYHVRGTSNIVVAPSVTENAVAHELTHALLEMPATSWQPMGYKWIYESLTEETHQIAHGQNVDEFQTNNGAYQSERRLLEKIIEFIQELGVDINKRGLLYAFSAPSTVQEQYFNDIQEKVYDAGFGDMNIFRAVNDIVEKEHRMITQEFPEIPKYQSYARAASRATNEVRTWYLHTKNEKHELVAAR